MNIRPLTVHVAASHGPAANAVPAPSSTSAQQNQAAISALLNDACQQALPHGRAAYLAVAGARDTIVLAIAEGLHSAAVDVPDSIASQLAKLGFSCQPGAGGQAGIHGPGQSSHGPEPEPEPAQALAASRHALREGPLVQPQSLSLFAQIPARHAESLRASAIAVLLDEACALALALDSSEGHRHGADRDWAARDTRTRVLEAVRRGDQYAQTALSGEVFAELAAELKRLGFALLSDTALMSEHFGVGPEIEPESKTGPELSSALAASTNAQVQNPQEHKAPVQPAHQPSATVELPGRKREAQQFKTLPVDDLPGIAAGKDAGGTRRLHFALIHGDAAEVTAFMAGLKGRLNTERLVEILATKGFDGAPGLYFALSTGHADTVTAFIEGLKGLGLNPQQIADIAQAKRSDGTPGLYLALQDGHTDTVTAFIEGLKGLGLNPQQIAEIVAAKHADGTPGLNRALANWHATAVTAYRDGLAHLQQQNLITAEQVADILDSEKSGSPPPFGTFARRRS